MPEICRFFGIIIRMFHEDHAQPHFHAEYGDEDVVIGIRTSSVVAGEIHPRALRMVLAWAHLHRAELLDNWNRVSRHLPQLRIPPLD